MTDDVLIYLLSQDDVQLAGFVFVLCVTLVFTLLYFWRAEK